MKEAHEKQERMQDLITFEIARAADTYERHRLSLPSYQVAIDTATANLALYQSTEDYIAAGDNASYATLLSRTQIQRTALANSIATLEAAIAPAETAVTTAENNYRDFLVNLLDVEYEVHRYEEKLANGEDVQASIDTYQQQYDDLKNNTGVALKAAIVSAEEAVVAANTAVTLANQQIVVMDEEIRVLSTAKDDFQAGMEATVNGTWDRITNTAWYDNYERERADLLTWASYAQNVTDETTRKNDAQTAKTAAEAAKTAAEAAQTAAIAAGGDGVAEQPAVDAAVADYDAAVDEYDGAEEGYDEAIDELETFEND